MSKFRLRMPLLYFPIQLVKDIIKRAQQRYQPLYGLRLYCGKQGSGKTYSMIHDLIELVQKYPNILVLSNMPIDYPCNIRYINSVYDITSPYNRGEQGTIVVLDEVQNFLCAGERNFPPELLAEITQQRKQHMCIMGTTQVFGRCSKELREQTFKVIKPYTLFGCITFYFDSDPIIRDGEIKDAISTVRWLGVQSEDVRGVYDSYKKPVILSK